MGWRKLGDDCEVFCRVLDDLVGGVDVLRDAVQRGKRLDGEGDTKMNWNEVWCPELERYLSSSSEKTSTKIENTKLALRRMKAVKKTLSSLLSSVDDTISTITNLIASECRAVGLANLPDDVLAQILEFCHLTSDEEDESSGLYYSQGLLADRLRSAGVLSSVSKRFRHIALGLPLLWKDVSFMTPRARFAAHANRCNRLCVYFGGGYGTANSELVEQIHPFRDWEELHFLYGNIKEGNEMIQGLKHKITEGTSFDSLKRLFIFDENDVDLHSAVVEQVSVERLEALTRTLASWSFPNLTHLYLANTIPSEPIQCPNATHVELVFKSFGTHFSICNLDHLRAFLQSMPKLASLAMQFDGNVQTRYNANRVFAICPMALPCLTSLDITLSGCPPLQVVDQFMDQVVTERLTKLRVSVYLGEQRPSDTRPCLGRDHFSSEWSIALFARLGDHEHIRPFSAVSDFSLDIVTEPALSSPTFSTIFEAIPNVQHLSLKLPDFLEINLLCWVEMYGRLDKLRSIRISDQPPYWLHQIEKRCENVAAKYSAFFQRFSNAEGMMFAEGRWERFKRMEVTRSSD